MAVISTSYDMIQSADTDSLYGAEAVPVSFVKRLARVGAAKRKRVPELCKHLRDLSCSFVPLARPIQRPRSSMEQGLGALSVC